MSELFPWVVASFSVLGGLGGGVFFGGGGFWFLGFELHCFFLAHTETIVHDRSPLVRDEPPAFP